jgi:RNA polymerase sigma factor (sigma-70 family)
MLRRDHPLSDPGPLIERVYSYAAYRLGPGPDAEDATSDTIERALRYRSSYDPNAGGAQAWLLGIARRVVDDHLARASRHAIHDLESRADQDREITTATIERLTLRSALTSLSPSERDLMALRYGADLPARDIARIVGARTNAVEVALHRTLAKLRRSIEDNSPAEQRDRERA